jgi:hypothetical protein
LRGSWLTSLLAQNAALPETRNEQLGQRFWRRDCRLQRKVKRWRSFARWVDVCEIDIPAGSAVR